MNQTVENKYPNYRVSVEAILFNPNNSKVFVCKRSDDCKVAPGKWNVPAGKVKYTELPDDAIIREVKEETKCVVTDFKRVSERVVTGDDADGNPTYRLVMTYFIKCIDQEPILDEEHSEGGWISVDELNGDKYTLDKELKNVIIKTIRNKQE